MTSNPRPLVLIESPLHSPTPWGKQLHRAYLEACIFDSLNRGEAPLATHKLYADALNDEDADNRTLGMSIAKDFHNIIEFVAVYYDLGISDGMKWGISEAQRVGLRLEPRSLYGHGIPWQHRRLFDQTEPEDIDDEIPF